MRETNACVCVYVCEGERGGTGHTDEVHVDVVDTACLPHPTVQPPHRRVELCETRPTA